MKRSYNIRERCWLKFSYNQPSHLSSHSYKLLFNYLTIYHLIKNLSHDLPSHLSHNLPSIISSHQDLSHNLPSHHQNLSHNLPSHLMSFHLPSLISSLKSLSRSTISSLISLTIYHLILPISSHL